VADVKKQEIEQHCTELVTPIIEEHGFELVDVEYVKEGSSILSASFPISAGIRSLSIMALIE
jgi:ribosome maturation factor RimP